MAAYRNGDCRLSTKVAPIAVPGPAFDSVITYWAVVVVGKVTKGVVVVLLTETLGRQLLGSDGDVGAKGTVPDAPPPEPEP